MVTAINYSFKHSCYLDSSKIFQIPCLRSQKYEPHQKLKIRRLIIHFKKDIDYLKKHYLIILITIYSFKVLVIFIVVAFFTISPLPGNSVFID